MSASSDAMKNFTAGWYNALVSTLSLDQKTFQLIQATRSIGITSEELWNMFDAVPPYTVGYHYDSAQLNRFSSDYQGCIAKLKGPEDQLQSILGDYYADWDTWRRDPDNVRPEDKTHVQWFEVWARQAAIPPGMENQAVSYLTSLEFDQPYAAITKFWAANKEQKGFVYNITHENVFSKMSTSPTGNISFNSSTMSTDVSHTWAGGSISGFYDCFFGSASGEYERLTVAISTAKLSITGKFHHFSQFSAAPLTAPSTDPTLSRYKPWFDFDGLNYGWAHRDYNHWFNPDEWDTYFGSNGSMPRVCGTIFVYDGLDIQITSEAIFSSRDQESFVNAAKAGFWPFFEVTAKVSWSKSNLFNDQGQLSARISNPVGSPQIFGVGVTPMENFIR